MKVKKSLRNIAQNLGRILKFAISLQIHPLGRILKPRHLCLAIVRPFRNLFLHRDSRCGHISLLFLWHSVQFGLVCISRQNRFCYCFS